MLPYHPTLRLKQGEYVAASRIAPGIQKYVRPRFVICPPKERDPEKGEPLTPDEIAHLSGERMGKYWPMRSAFVDPQFVAPALGDSGLETLFRIARGRNPNLIPVATVNDLFNPVYSTFLRSTSPRLGVYVPYSEVEPENLLEGLRAIGSSPQDTVVFVDFTGTDLTPEIAAGSVAGILDYVNECAVWARIVFQGSAFPAKNPVDAGADKLVPRDEWKTFSAALRECSVQRDVIAYGDFGADCGEMTFSTSGGGIPIRYLRYTTPDHTLVVRGSKDGQDREVMKEVFQRILDSDHFAGQHFSYADDRIWRGAKGLDGCGNASMWREWNTAHHITRVVRDLGAMEGIQFSDGRVSKLSQQINWLEDDNAVIEPVES